MLPFELATRPIYASQSETIRSSNAAICVPCPEKSNVGGIDFLPRNAGSFGWSAQFIVSLTRSLATDRKELVISTPVSKIAALTRRLSRVSRISIAP
jgi:hypothetical protein